MRYETTHTTRPQWHRILDDPGSHSPFAAVAAAAVCPLLCLRPSLRALRPYRFPALSPLMMAGGKP